MKLALIRMLTTLGGLVLLSKLAGLIVAAGLRLP